MSDRCYDLCGVTLETAWPLVTPLVATDCPDSVDLKFLVVAEPPSAKQWHFTGSKDAESRNIRSGRVGDVEVVRISNVGDAWFVSDDEIQFHLRHPDRDYQVEVLLLGLLFALWLDLRGGIALHAAAAAGPTGAVGFLGPNGTGKTSLALGLRDLGWQLVTDDLLAVSTGLDVCVYPSFPQVRLWPADAERHFGAGERFDRAHPDFDKLRIPLTPGELVGGARPLTALYLPRRGPYAGAVHIEQVSGPAVLFHLMFNSFARVLVDVARHRPDWMRRLSALLDHVPLFTLLYPDDPTRSAEVAKAVADHAAGLAAQSN